MPDSLVQVCECSKGGAPIHPDAERCDYCGYWLKDPPKTPPPPSEPIEYERSYHGSSHGLGTDLVFVFAIIMLFPILFNLLPRASPNATITSGNITNTIASSFGGALVILLPFILIAFVGIIIRKCLSPNTS